MSTIKKGPTCGHGICSQNYIATGDASCVPEARLGDVRNYARQCNGSLNFHRHGMYRRLIYTDGVKLLAEKLRAYWLIDAIMSHLQANAALRAEEFQVWELKLNGRGAILRCHDGDKGDGERELAKQAIEYTDFPDDWKLYCEANGEGFTLMLPEER